MTANTVTLGTYAGDKVYQKDKSKLNMLKSSGIGTVIPWTIHISNKGDLYFNETTNMLASEGIYRGYPSWNGVLQALKTGGTVSRIVLSVGCCGQFTEIANLGTKSGGALYKNFQAIHEALPAIDGIDFDNESKYDTQVTADFALMLHAIGFKEVTFCPYTNMSYWVESLNAINKHVPGFVTAFHLQCYSGGAGNHPLEWMEALNGAVQDPPNFVFPGLAAATLRGGDTPEAMTEKLKWWSQLCQSKFKSPLKGAWLWNYDAIVESNDPPRFDAYVAALKAGLGS
ncbi:MAG: hypothetical protein HC897_14155 [Thermoanaerobaculia bacterium]|nr:hypothetical protein [Thermoanaerobaculia bacterium]